MLNEIAAIWHRKNGIIDQDVLLSFSAACSVERINLPSSIKSSWALYSGGKIYTRCVSSHQTQFVADSHLHNLSELSKKLGLELLGGYEQNVSKVLEAAYQRWGVNFVRHLKGDFALCWFDQAKQSLMMMRDRLGNKPLYYAQAGDYIVACSSIKTLLDSGLIDTSLYSPRLADYIVLRSESVEPERTFYQHVYRVLPAYYLEVDRHRIDTYKYWQLRATKVLSLQSDAEYAEAFYEQLCNSVNRCVLHSTNVASMLSGGLDSSAISALAVENSDMDSLITLSAMENESKRTYCVESNASRLVASKLQSSNYTISPAEFTKQVGCLHTEFKLSTNPFDSLMMNTSLAVIKLAKEKQVDVLLDGLDGGGGCWFC